MDTEARKAAFTEDKAWSLQALERLVDIKVIPRVHPDDGMLTDHFINMPKSPPPPTADEVKEIVRAELAEHDREC